MRNLDRKDSALSVMLLLVAMAMAKAMWPVNVEPVLRLQLLRNGAPITHLDQSRDIVESREVRVDRLDLASGGRLRHPVLGDIGFGDNFFLDARTRFEVLETGDYRFMVGSDDGFALRVDQRPICAHPRPRAMAVQVCGVRLDAGMHDLALDYFQAGGASGLTVRYARQDQRDSFWVGEDSPWVRFER